MLQYLTVAKFISQRSGETYLVKRNLKTGGISCNCRGWIYYKNCKHTNYVKSNSFVELTDIPTYQETLAVNWGRDLEEKEKWTVEHLKPIVL